jgi:hypothetical protein
MLSIRTCGVGEVKGKARKRAAAAARAAARVAARAVARAVAKVRAVDPRQPLIDSMLVVHSTQSPLQK